MALIIGKVYRYKDIYPVLITNGEYECNGRVSNFWSFQYIRKNGTLGKKGHDYDTGQFELIKNAKIVTRVVGFKRPINLKRKKNHW